ncbi:hypothetical protein AVEN_65516-1 [Araneus ventricosus]|uniref:Uncharacterized protein n=1 Tax=Araneus ventricosus TaxID=182803 RepID=A0A4Y2FGJ8_ARAVE|nr:hypothetical protein AVEN_65516-1 [Araneus ventricosus]
MPIRVGQHYAGFTSGKEREEATRTSTDRNRWVCKGAVGLHVSLGSPAADSVGERQWQTTTADRHFAVVSTCASSHSTLHSTKGMRSIDFISTDTNRCVCK